MGKGKAKAGEVIMKVKELVDLLNKCDPEMEVMFEASESGSHYLQYFDTVDNCVYLSGED